MARKSKAALPVADDEVDEVDDLEVDDEVEDEVEDLEEVDDVDGDDSEVEGLTAKALAKLLGTNARDVRKFLRHEKGKVGQGKRWDIDPDQVDELRKKFAEWGKRTRKTEKKPKAPVADDAADEVEELNDELDDISDIEDLDDLELDD